MSLGGDLLARGVLTEDQLRIALIEQNGEDFARTLVRLGFVSEAVIGDVLAATFGHARIDPDTVIPDPAALACLSKEAATRHRALPLALDGIKLTVALANPHDLPLLDQLRRQLGGLQLDIRCAGEAAILQAIGRHYGHELSINGLLREIETGAEPDPGESVIRLIDALLADAVTQGASDLHFEPEEHFIRIRYRIDGVLRQIRALHRRCWPAMVVRLKVLAGLNIAETRAPQDGRMSLTLAGRAVDFRVASQPTVWGENLVVRVLDRARGLVALDALGLPETSLAVLRLMLARPEGLLLLSGPTGSGKTTTLYSILSEINSVAVNIMTLEDPVEYPLAMVRQTGLSDAVKMDFADGIRAMLRQDPDVILIGEIRDRETADMALRAALTGHQVFSTLHCNSAVGAIPRLLDLGIAPDLIAGNLIGVVAQRLVRRLCHCATRVPASPLEQRLLNINEPILLPRPVGCPDCGHQGYRGRIAIMEVLRLDARLEALVARRATRGELSEAAESAGMTSLADEACRRVLAGETCLDEVRRVVDLTARMTP